MIAMTTSNSISVKPCSFVIRASSLFSFPLRHLFGKRTLRAIGIVLQAKVFVNLQKRLLMRDCFGEIAAARTVAEQTRGSGFEPAIGQARRQLCIFWPSACPERS